MFKVISEDSEGKVFDPQKMDLEQEHTVMQSHGPH